MKNQGAMSWLFAMLLSLAMLTAPFGFAGDQAECSKVCQASSGTQSQDALAADWFSKKPWELVCKNPRSSDLKNWTEWQGQLMKKLVQTEMASNSSDTMNRRPAQSTN